MITNIHRWLLVRLAGVWLILSIVNGALFHYLSHARLEEHILAMAKADASPYQADFEQYLKSPSNHALELLRQKIRAVIENDSFVLIRLSCADSNQIAQATGPLAKEIAARVPLPEHEDTSTLDSVGGKLTVTGETYLQVRLPVVSDMGTGLGYLDGIYRAPDDILEHTEKLHHEICTEHETLLKEKLEECIRA